MGMVMADRIALKRRRGKRLEKRLGAIILFVTAKST